MNEGLALLAELQLNHRFLNPFVNVYKQACRSKLPELERAQSAVKGGRGKRGKERCVLGFFKAALPFFLGPRMAIVARESLNPHGGSPLRFGDREAGSGPKVQGALSETFPTFWFSDKFGLAKGGKEGVLTLYICIDSTCIYIYMYAYIYIYIYMRVIPLLLRSPYQEGSIALMGKQPIGSRTNRDCLLVLY